MQLTSDNTLVLFDISGVLIKPGRIITNLLSKIVNVSPECIHKYYDTYVLGKISHDEFWIGVKQCLQDEHPKKQNTSINTSIVEQEFYAKQKLNHFVINLAKKLQASHYALGILSNKTKEWALHDIKLFNKAGLNFKYLFISGFIGVAKPNPKIFEYVKSQINKKYKHIIFIDDKDRNLEVAQKHNFISIKYPFAQTSIDIFNKLIQQ